MATVSNSFDDVNAPIKYLPLALTDMDAPLSLLSRHSYTPAASALNVIWNGCADDQQKQLSMIKLLKERIAYINQNVSLLDDLKGQVQQSGHPNPELSVDCASCCLSLIFIHLSR